MLTLASALRREPTAQRYIPYGAHIAPEVIRTDAGDYLQVFRLGGMSFECADSSQINHAHERLNILLRNLADPGIAFWVHVVRRREPAVPASGAPGFAGRLHERYRRRLCGERLMVNELYLSVLYRPAAGRARHALSRLLSRAQPEAARLEGREALEICSRVAQSLGASLAPYDPQPLGCYRDGRRWNSSALEFLGLLVNGEARATPLPRGPLGAALATSRLFFGTEVIEYRLPTGIRAGAMLGIKEYPTPSMPGMLDALLSAPFTFVLTQSFTYLSRTSAQALLTRQINRMANAGDFAVSQAEELEQALDALTSNEFVMGDHHLSLQVICDLDPEDGETSGRLRTLEQQLAQARALLADTGMTVAREDLALEAAFWAQLPGNFAFRPRKAPVTSRNFVALAPLHNYPAGRASGNHWGEALTLLKTRARSAYHFSLHADGSAAGRRDTGHTFICGPTGSGKTVLVGFLVAMLHRAGATQVVLDKDRGLEILVRALGGEYLRLRNGEPTGFNPLALSPGPAQLEFLRGWLQLLARPGNGRTLSVREQQDLDQALRGVLALAPEARRLSRVLEFLDPTDPEGVHARLARWCAEAQGDYAWVFDNPTDAVAGRLCAANVFGFDVTEFLDNERCRAPICLYLFHLVRRLLDGRRLVCWMDEFWRLLEDPAFEQFAKDGPKTWRKLNGVMALATQSVSDVLNSRISRTIIEQTPTKILFPNPAASKEEYTQGLGLTQREAYLVREGLDPAERAFLVKQGQQSVVCRLDLAGLEPEMEVISGRASGLERLERLMRECGPEPEQWLQPFLAATGTG